MILDTIAASTRVRVAAAKEKLSPSELMKRLDKIELKPGKFADALTAKDGVSIIAEIKKASPSKGLIRADFDHMEIAAQYMTADVQALSILTEPEFFKGSLQFVRDTKAKYDIPVLRKEFIVAEYQIYEAKLAGADAVLLIMAMLTDDEFKRFHSVADELKLDVLVETHNETEVKRALEYGRIIGVNNRNLQTFEEDITTCERLLPLIEGHKIKVAESAVRTHEDYEYLKGLNFDAALIGEAFMRERDIKKAVDRLRYGE